MKGDRARAGQARWEVVGGGREKEEQQQHKDCGSGESGRRCGGREIRSPGVVVGFWGRGLGWSALSFSVE